MQDLLARPDRFAESGDDSGRVSDRGCHKLVDRRRASARENSGIALGNETFWVEHQSLLSTDISSVSASTVVRPNSIAEYPGNCQPKAQATMPRFASSGPSNSAAMSNLYDTDILAWSERQADLLRRVAAGERANDQVDWGNVAEEIEDIFCFFISYAGAAEPRVDGGVDGRPQTGGERWLMTR